MAKIGTLEEFQNGVQGFYKNIDFEVYRSLKAVNAGTLKEMKRSPLHFKYLYDNPRKDTDSLSLGRLTHKAVFEPEEFKKFIVMPKFDGRTTVGKNDKAKWISEHEGFEAVEQDEYNSAVAIRDACYNHSTAKALLETKSHHELTIVWNDNGVLCKGRIDRYILHKDKPVVLDLKTCQDARDSKFNRDIIKYQYYYSLAFYLKGLEIITGKPHKQSIIIAVESLPPHGVLCRWLGSGYIANGFWEIDEDLKTFKKCNEENNWYGYTNEIITTIPPPNTFENQ